jgi:hypothetical protein
MSTAAATTTEAKPVRCLRCGRKLTRSLSYGPTCLRKIRAAAASAELAGMKPEQRAKAAGHLEDGGLVPAGRPGLFLAASSDGSNSYLVDVPAGTCLCRAGQKGHSCYHLAGGRIVTAAASRLAA